MDMSLKRKLSEIDGSASARKRQHVNDVNDDPNLVKVGSRKSQLALIQTHTIMNRLKADNPHIELELETMDTLGDQILHVALPKIGEKSLFTKDLEIALEAKRVDLLVHSLKDLPTTMPEGMAIGTVYKRDDPHDCVVFHSKHAGKELKDLPPDSIIGTSSLRRISQLKKSHPHLQFKSVRGNLNTRFRKLEEESLYDALILAKAGLDRMGWSERCGQVLKEEDCLYAIGQGAMAVEVRGDDKRTIQLVGELSDIKTLLTVSAERSFMRTLNGGCSTPIGCYSKFNGEKFSLRGNVLSTDGKKCVDCTVEDTIRFDIQRESDKQKTYSMSNFGVLIDDLYKDELAKAEALGSKLADELIKLGADEILREVRAQIPKVANIHIPTSSSVNL